MCGAAHHVSGCRWRLGTADDGASHRDQSDRGVAPDLGTDVGALIENDLALMLTTLGTLQGGGGMSAASAAAVCCAYAGPPH
jgi:hypothetical protein